LATILAGCSTTSVAIQESQSSIAGCYDVVLSEWNDPDEVLDNENIGQFGPIIRLTEEEVWRPLDQKYFKRAVFQGSDNPDALTATWRFDDSKLTITTLGFVGYATYLEPTPTGFTGVLRLVLDYESTEPWAEIELTMTPCA
jgi:hypothetical protein